MLLDAIRFQSDPGDTRLEANDVAILLRSDVRAHIDDATKRIDDSKLFTLTSIRRGFAGGGFEGAQSLPKQMALAAGIPGADLIPDTSELFLGFTSTQKAGMGPGQIANFETLGYVDFRGSDYFRHGTHMHLSHIHEDLEAWYLNFDFDERVATAFRPNLSVKQDTQTVPQGPKDVSTERRRARATTRARGESATAQRSRRPRASTESSSRSTEPCTRRGRRSRCVPTSTRSTTRSTGLCDPDEIGATPRRRRAFRRLQPDERRLLPQPARDGRRASRRHDRLRAARPWAGLQPVLSTTHRQNFLVPPRRHRSFPLV